MSTVKETAEIETGMAEKSSWDLANIRQKLGLVWRNRKKISQIIKDYFYLLFFLLIILWCTSSFHLSSDERSGLENFPHQICHGKREGIGIPIEEGRAASKRPH